jgi:PKHD-type hydroxylase
MESFTDKLVYTVPSKLPDELITSMVKYLGEKSYESSMTSGMLNESFRGARDASNAVRSSQTSWLNWDEWIPGIIHNMMITANKEYFNYDLTHFATQIQATVYTGESKDHYTWHTDGGRGVMKRENDVILERKLSCSLLLSGPEEYTGGELQFHYNRNFFYSTRPSIGEAIIFPSWVPHRVRPVKTGKRISVVAWMNGPCFK